MDFEDCKDLSDEDIRRLLEAIPRDTFVNAVAGASPEVKQRFYDNLSAKAVKMIEEDLRHLTPQTDSDAARKEVMTIALTLEGRSDS